jgi:hypothetical protein
MSKTVSGIRDHCSEHDRPGHLGHGGHRLTVHPPEWRHRIHPPALLLRGISRILLFVFFFDFRRFHGLRERQRQRVAVIWRGLAALLHVSFAFEHQQVAAVNVV